MFDSLQLGRAFRLLLQTTPILLIRFGMYLAFWLVALIYLGVVLTVAVLLGKLIPFLGFIVGLIGFVSLAPIYKLAYQYFFFMLKAAHVAVISELLQHGQLPAGVNQVQWGKQQVQQRFGQVSVMFLVDEMVRGVIRMFTGTVWTIARFIPGDQSSIVNVLNRVIRYATNYIDEAVLARAFWRREENIWESAEQGVVLYAQVWKPLLKNAVVLMLLSYVPFIVAFIVFAFPVGALLSLVSSTLASWSVLIVLVLAVMIKIAIGDSFAMAAMIAAYQRETQNLVPDPQMEAQLSRVSNKFVELKQRAAAAAPTMPGQPAVPAAPSMSQ